MEFAANRHDPSGARSATRRTNAPSNPASTASTASTRAPAAAFASNHAAAKALCRSSAASSPPRLCFAASIVCEKSSGVQRRCTSVAQLKSRVSSGSTTMLIAPAFAKNAVARFDTG